MVNPGSESVTFVQKSSNGRDSLGNRIVKETAYQLDGCSFQPAAKGGGRAGVDDEISDTAYSEATFMVICPGTPAALAILDKIQPTDTVLFGGVSHRIVGKKAYRDLLGRSDHVTVIVEEQHS